MSNFESMSFSGKSINCYGLEVVKTVLKKYGHSVFDYDKKSDYPILFSLYWPEQIYDFLKWRYGQKKDRKIIVGGNTATANPSPIISSGCYCYLGDGELWDGSFDHKHIVKIDCPTEKALSLNISPVKYEDLQDSRRAFCEMSRGCANKCMFCQYGWLKPYRECDIEDIKNIITSAKTKSLRLFAADRFQHTRYRDIRGIMDKAGKCDTGSDVSMRFVYNNTDYLKYTNKVRCGLEGMSERLRRLIGKPFKDEMVVNFCKMVADAGIKSLDFYMIYGLPTEEKEDIQCFVELINKIDTVMPDGYCIAFHWNAFTPSAQTPFQWAKSSFGYDRTYLERLVLGKDRINKRIKIMNKPTFTSDYTIVQRLLCIRASDEVYKLIYNIAIKGGQLKKDYNFIIKEYERLVGVSLVDEWPLEKQLPWDKYVIYDREKMLDLYKRKLLKCQDVE